MFIVAAASELNNRLSELILCCIPVRCFENIFLRYWLFAKTRYQTLILVDKYFGPLEGIRLSICTSEIL